MNILIQNPFMHAGGAENRMRGLMQALTRRKDIDNVHFMYMAPESHYEKQAEGKFHIWQTRTGHTEKVTKTIIKNHDIDVLQFHNNQVVTTDGLALAQKIGIPTVWVMHDFWPLCHNRFLCDVWRADAKDLCRIIDPVKCIDCVGDYYYRLTKKQREVINKCNVAVVPSERIKKIFEDNNLLKGRLEIITPWIDLEFYQPNGAIQRNPWQVFFAGNFIPHKGINVLLKAWSLVQRRIPMARLIAQGDQRCLNETIAFAKGLKLQNVSLIQRLSPNDLRNMYNQSAITVFPSIWEETCGLIWVESLSCGTPVVASETGSIPELLKYGGETFEPRNHVELAERIIDFLLSPSKRNNYAVAGHKYVNENFDVKLAVERFIKLYHRIMLEELP